MGVEFIPFTVPVVAIVGGIGAGMFKRWCRLQERRLELSATHAVEKAAQYAARSERLEQRVAVLERILTDRSAHLADEIERLRDQPLN